MPSTTALTPVNNLLHGLLNETTDIALMIQVAILLAALTFAWLASRQLVNRMRPEIQTKWNAAEWKRFLVPLIAQLAVIVARPVLAEWHTTHLLSLAQPLLLSMFVIQFSFFLLRSIIQPGPGLRSVERVVSWLVWGIVALHITGHLGTLVKSLDAIGFNVGKQHISLYTAFIGLVTIAVTVITAMSAGRFIERHLIAGSTLNVNLKVALSKIMRALLLVIAVLITLPLVGIDITVLSVFGGALGVGLGLGLQKIASNYVSGFTLLLDQSLRIGDMVTVNNQYGEITRIATRYTVIRGLDGTETIIPNETLITSAVTNHTLANRDNRIGLPVQVAYGTDLDKARSLMLDAAHGHPRVQDEPQPQVLLKGFGESGIDLELSFWIADPEEGQLSLKSDINWKIWDAFRREGIEIPYPQRVVHLVQPPSA